MPKRTVRSHRFQLPKAARVEAGEDILDAGCVRGASSKPCNGNELEWSYEQACCSLRAIAVRGLQQLDYSEPITSQSQLLTFFAWHSIGNEIGVCFRLLAAVESFYAHLETFSIYNLVVARRALPSLIDNLLNARLLRVVTGGWVLFVHLQLPQALLGARRSFTVAHCVVGMLSFYRQLKVSELLKVAKHRRRVGEVITVLRTVGVVQKLKMPGSRDGVLVWNPVQANALQSLPSLLERLGILRELRQLMELQLSVSDNASG
mmetsp:Transcript_18600/g.71773  ORF Transcript_18600/g.71773 Transcript_18600/m.71773 type:complete len:262 (-) Transcript_18600:2622-3407(-)